MNSALPKTVVAIPRDRARHGVIVAMTALCCAIHHDLLQHRADDRRIMLERVELFEDAGAG